MIFKNQILKINDFIAERPKLQYYLPQALTAFFIIFIIGYFSFNAGVNMEEQGLTTGFGFLLSEAHLLMDLTVYQLVLILVQLPNLT